MQAESENIFVIKDYRKIRNDHTFSYGDKFYLIESPLKHSIAKQKIEIRTTAADGFSAYFAGRKLTISEVIEPTKPSILDLDIQRISDRLSNEIHSICNHFSFRDTKVTIRLDAEDGRLRARYSNIANADTYISRKQTDRLL